MTQILLITTREIRKIGSNNFARFRQLKTSITSLMCSTSNLTRIWGIGWTPTWKTSSSFDVLVICFSNDIFFLLWSTSKFKSWKWEGGGIYYRFLRVLRGREVSINQKVYFSNPGEKKALCSDKYSSDSPREESLVILRQIALSYLEQCEVVWILNKGLRRKHMSIMRVY